MGFNEQTLFRDRGGYSVKNTKHKTDLMIHVKYISILVLFFAIFFYILYKNHAFNNNNDTLDVIVDNGMTIIVSIVCSILASIIFANVMDRKNEIKQEIFKEELTKIIDKVYDEKIDDGVQRISNSVSEIYNNTIDLMPSRYYRSADFPNLEFNNFLNNKIVESRKFVYFGESARFTCKRLYELKDKNPGLKNLRIEIFIVNPECNTIFEKSKAFLSIKEKNQNNGNMREWDEIIEIEKKKVLSCLYGLMELRSSLHRIDIYLIDDIPFIDIEMTDDMIALEYFRTRDDYKRYPLTIIFENKKAYYESYEFYLDWEKEKAMHINGEDLSAEYIIKLGEKAGIEKLTHEDLKEYCEKEIFYKDEKYI